jgi:hypothetical protein
MVDKVLSSDEAKLTGTFVEVAGSAVAVPLTGTELVDVVLASYTIPANAMGPNGLVIVDSLWSALNNNSNSKIAKIYFGGTAGTVVGINLANNLSTSFTKRIRNRNSVISQIVEPGPIQGFGAANSAPNTFAIDTAAPVVLTLVGFLGHMTDGITLEAWRVSVFWRL